MRCMFVLSWQEADSVLLERRLLEENESDLELRRYRVIKSTTHSLIFHESLQLIIFCLQLFSVACDSILNC